MANNAEERSPDEWRELLRNGINYPDEVEGLGRRRDRRRARKMHRQAAARQTREWIREERRRDPIKPGAALVVVLLVLALGAGARWLWPGLVGEGNAGRVTATANPNSSSSPSQDNEPGPSGAATPSPSLSSDVDLSDPDKVAQEAVRLYLTRNPPVDHDHDAVVRRAAPYLTAALAENLTNHSDPAWDKLVSNGGVSTVRTVTVAPAGTDLPADTPLRVWRKTTATVDVEGYKKYTETTVLQVEVTTDGNGSWHVSRILGL